MTTVAIVGGTGVYDPSWIGGTAATLVRTPYGEVEATAGRLGAVAVWFLNRHGRGHAVPPHRVNYRANIWALRELGVTRVIATAAVGAIHRAMGPGSLVIVDQFLDFTKSRPTTFFDGGPGGVVHTDMSWPYCPDLGQRLWQAGKNLALPVVRGGVYAATEGPRFETAAEIQALARLGGDVVGMTGVPEVVLARELGMCYACVAIVTNFAAGVSSSALSHQEVLAVMDQQAEHLRGLLARVVPDLGGPPACACQASRPEPADANGDKGAQTP